MYFRSQYDSPLGPMIMEFDANALRALWFIGQKYSPSKPVSAFVPDDYSVFQETRQWLDCYFNGIQPDFMPPIFLQGSIFQKTVWQILLRIPYGETVTYGEIAREVAQKRGLKCMSAQAVGGAIGHNPIGVIVPCHRVVGSNGSLTGYAAGIDKKIQLLQLEKADMAKLYRPTKGTAL